MDIAQKILDCQNLCFFHGTKQILDDISFSLTPGEFCAILGRNGSGKTTLIHCLNRILIPETGQVRVNDQDIMALSQTEIARQVSLVPQEHLDIFPFQVLDVVVMGRAPFLGISQRPGPQEYERAMTALNDLNAGYLAHKNFNRISGGERRITLLARALVQASSLMLLDEPTNHLDFNNQYTLLAAIKQLCRQKGVSIVATLHDPNMAVFFADKVVMIKEGTLMAQGKTKSVMTQKNMNALYDTRVTPVCVTPQKNVFFPHDLINEDLHGN